MLAALRAHLGVERTVIVQASCHGSDNRAMFDAIADDPARIRGVWIVDGTFGDAEFQAPHDGGVRGARFNFVRHIGGRPDMDLFHRAVDRIREMGWHIVLHVDAPDIIPLSDMIRALPLPFVIDRMGRVPGKDCVDQPPLMALLELAKRHNAWINVCGAERISFPPYAKAVPIAQASIAVAPDRVLSGTDFPHPNPTHETDEADLVDPLPQFTDDPVQQCKLLVDNPARLYDFAPL